MCVHGDADADGHFTSLQSLPGDRLCVTSVCVCVLSGNGVNGRLPLHTTSQPIACRLVNKSHTNTNNNNLSLSPYVPAIVVSSGRSRCAGERCRELRAVDASDGLEEGESASDQD